ncbi:MAG: hypothetical protein HZB70_02690 [Candidatus Berkelbacteria bacterium]|nr:MAG: hypothetical protein HZB70_02690 [Candidatus Berkelbacteria bacterium]QQG51786.1 MAG: hypothetical protein HY845_00305 [Candidatus Berkelbacteria bacterium]
MSKSRNLNAHQAPKTPGWKVLHKAVETVLQPPFSTEEAAWFQLQLLARATEHIPTNSLAMMAPKLVRGCCSVYAEHEGWPSKVALFFDSQIGPKALGELLVAEEGWRLEVVLGTETGYVVLNGNYKPPITQADLIEANRLGRLVGPGSKLSRASEGLLVVSRP